MADRDVTRFGDFISDEAIFFAGTTPGRGWRKCTASRQTGPGGLPLVLRLSEGLGHTATEPKLHEYAVLIW